MVVSNDIVKDVDGILKQFIDQLPTTDGEILYKAEIDGQIKIYIFQTMLGFIMILVSLLVWYKVA